MNLKTLASLILAMLFPVAVLAQQTTLTCTMTLVKKEGGTKGDVTYVVDFDKKTVNEAPATITEDKIETVKKMPWGIATTRINRVTGGAEWLNGDATLATGECVKAFQRRF